MDAMRIIDDLLSIVDYEALVMEVRQGSISDGRTNPLLWSGIHSP
jgi:hypothetical protein